MWATCRLGAIATTAPAAFVGEELLYELKLGKCFDLPARPSLTGSLRQSTPITPSKRSLSIRRPLGAPFLPSREAPCRVWSTMLFCSVLPVSFMQARSVLTLLTSFLADSSAPDAVKELALPVPTLDNLVEKYSGAQTPPKLELARDETCRKIAYVAAVVRSSQSGIELTSFGF